MKAGTNRFRDRIDRGLITTLDALRSEYKALVKRYHPDLNDDAPALDFDRLKKDYAEAFAYLLSQLDRTPEPAPAPAPPEPAGPPPELANRDAFLDEFRELVARGFPVNSQAAAKNRAYAASVRRVAGYLAAHLGDADFFVRADRQARELKRRSPRLNWYLLQIFWNLGDWRITGFDYYRRIFIRHREFIRPTLEEEGLDALVRLVDLVTGGQLT